MMHIRRITEEKKEEQLELFPELRDNQLEFTEYMPGIFLIERRAEDDSEKQYNPEHITGLYKKALRLVRSEEDAPGCCYCPSYRVSGKEDTEQNWERMPNFLSTWIKNNSGISHTYCPPCMEEELKEIRQFNEERRRKKQE